jgi:hypothetical protein
MYCRPESTSEGQRISTSNVFLSVRTRGFFSRVVTFFIFYRINNKVKLFNITSA